jgi:hypothetical protein
MAQKSPAHRPIGLYNSNTQLEMLPNPRNPKEIFCTAQMIFYDLDGLFFSFSPSSKKNSLFEKK